MAVRRAKVEDALAIASASVAAWHFAYRGVVPDEMLTALNLQERAERLTSTWKPDRYVLVATDDDGNVVGFAVDQFPASHGYDSELAALYVHPDHARMGYGRALVAAMAQYYLENDRRSLCIHTLRDNKIGRSFYERLGGIVFAEDTWRELPAVWYGWSDVRTI